MKKFPLFLLVLFTGLSLQASTRISSNYSITAEVTDGGGLRTASASYTNDGEIDETGGLTSSTTPNETAKTGYIGQLYDVEGLSLTAPQQTVNAGATLQFSADEVLDDATLLSISNNAITWSVSNPSVATIDSGGLVTASSPAQNTSVNIQGSYQGFTITYALTVLGSAASLAVDTPTMPAWALIVMGGLLLLLGQRTFSKDSIS